jgi:hypothetical protein
MDEIVRQAMAKWPNVPAVYGWLALDRRGSWLIKEEHIGNPMLIDFIGRNYARDEVGRWFFQNGPQRVFVRLAYTPWVLRTAGDGSLITHTGLPVTGVAGVWLDEDGVLILDTEHGAGVLDDRDVEAVSVRFTRADGGTLSEDDLIEAVEDVVAGKAADLRFSYGGRALPMQSIHSGDVPRRLGFVRDPEPATAATEA